VDDTVPRETKFLQVSVVKGRQIRMEIDRLRKEFLCIDELLRYYVQPRFDGTFDGRRAGHEGVGKSAERD
jgi:hypothetical protein